MAQNSPVICSTCGARSEPGQRFCSECGTTLNTDVNKATELASGESYAPPRAQQAPTVPAEPFRPDATVITPASNGQSFSAGSGTQGTQGTQSTPASTYANAPVSGSQFYSETTDANVIPPPPPPDSYISLPLVTPQGVPASAPAAPSSSGTFAPVPAYAQAPKRSRGCLVVSIVLLLILAAGAAGLYFGVIKPRLGNNSNTQQTPPGQQNTQIANNTPSTSSTTTTPGTTPTGSNTSTPSSGPSSATSEQVNLAFTYSDIKYTITTVEYAPGFADDTSLSAGGVRIAFKESNPSSNAIIFAYSEVARLVLPDGTTSAPANELHYASPSSQASDSNWLDFQVASQPADLSKLVLEMGLTTENQMNIPLSPGADLSQYQSKSATPNATFTYAGLNWTLTKATVSYSADGHQATTGNIYVTITLHVVNNSSETFVNAPSSYMRLQVGGAINAPVDTPTLTSYMPSQTNTQGTVTFLAPQGNTTYTLQMLAQQGPPPISAASQNFQVG